MAVKQKSAVRTNRVRKSPPQNRVLQKLVQTRINQVGGYPVFYPCSRGRLDAVPMELAPLCRAVGAELQKSITNPVEDSSEL